MAEQSEQGFCLAFFQKTPKAKSTIQAVLSLESDGKIYVQTAKGKKPIKSASLVTADGTPLLSNNLNYLKELARQSKLSQISYEYTSNIDRVKEFLNVLVNPNSLK